MTEVDTTDLVTVRLLAVPLKLWERGEAHHDELMREFALAARTQQEPDHPTVPARLIELIAALTETYGASTSEVDELRAEALAAGLDRTDLTYQVPASARDAGEALGAMLDEADEYCRAGQDLITLETPPDALAFRRWYVDQFRDQIDGLPATPWPGPWT